MLNLQKVRRTLNAPEREQPEPVEPEQEKPEPAAPEKMEWACPDFAALRDAAKFAARGAPRQTSLPALEHLRVSCDGRGEGRVAGASLEIHAEAAFPMDGPAGAVCVPAKAFLGAVNAAKGARRAFWDIRGNKAALSLWFPPKNSVDCGRETCTQFALFPAEEWPAWAAPPEGAADGPLAAARLPLGRLADALARAAKCANPKDPRREIRGPCAQISEGELVIVGTDGKRLTAFSGLGAAVEAASKPVSLTLPLEAAKALAAAPAFQEGAQARLEVMGELGPVALVHGTALVRVSGDGWALWARPVSDRYPNWRAVLPGEPRHVLDMDRKEAILAVRRAARFQEGVSAAERSIGFAVGADGRLVCWACDPALGAFEQSLSDNGEAPPGALVAFHCARLAEALKGACGKRVLLKLRGPRGLVAIEGSADAGGKTRCLMPRTKRPTRAKNWRPVLDRAEADLAFKIAGHAAPDPEAAADAAREEIMEGLAPRLEVAEARAATEIARRRREAEKAAEKERARAAKMKTHKAAERRRAAAQEFLDDAEQDAKTLPAAFAQEAREKVAQEAREAATKARKEAEEARFFNAAGLLDLSGAPAALLKRFLAGEGAFAKLPAGAGLVCQDWVAKSAGARPEAEFDSDYGTRLAVVRRGAAQAGRAEAC